MNKSVIKYITGVLVAVCVGLFCWYCFDIIAYILISVIVAFVGRPIVDALGRVKIGEWRPGNGLKATIALIAIWSVAILFFYWIVPLVYGEFNSIKSWDAEGLIKSLDAPLTTAEEYLRSFGLVKGDADLKSTITMAAGSVFSLTGLTDIFSKFAGALSTIAIGVFSVTFISFFFLKDSGLFTKMILTFSPTKYEEQVKSALNSCEKLLVRYSVGLLLEMLAVMTLNTIGLSIVGLDIKQALVIAMITGLMVIIPYIGPIIGMLVGLSIVVVTDMGTMDFTTQLLPRLIYMEIVFLLTKGFDVFIFQPYVYGNSVHAHPLEVFLILLVAGSVAGIPGMIFAIPAYTILRVVLVEFFSKYNLVQKITANIRKDMTE